MARVRKFALYRATRREKWIDESSWGSRISSVSATTNHRPRRSIDKTRQRFPGSGLLRSAADIYGVAAGDRRRRNRGHGIKTRRAALLSDKLANRSTEVVNRRSSITGPIRTLQFLPNANNNARYAERRVFDPVLQLRSATSRSRSCRFRCRVK